MSDEIELERQFWKRETPTKPYVPMAVLAERHEEYLQWLIISRVLGRYTPTDLLKSGADDTIQKVQPSIKNFLNLKKENAASEAVARVVASSDEEAAEKAIKFGVFDEDTQQILTAITNEISKKYLEMYFDCYMAPLHSDIKWRLGPVTGIYMPTNEIKDETGLLTEDGRMYTRSNMYFPFKIKYWSYGEIAQRELYYANMFFPPYKMGLWNVITKKYKNMPRLLKKNPGMTFDQDKFSVKREGFTYREPGFKALNDNIMFIQWLVEQTTGIVSTYLTEWDLSLYMQENLMTPQANGGPSKLYLNYRVMQDNPLATTEQGYDNEKGLCFSVINSAVSKINYDCQKPWRPSDYPLSCYWTPYRQNVDWEMLRITGIDPDTEEEVNIPYASWADEPANYDFQNNGLKDILKHQDYIGMATGLWPNPYMEYFQALYYTDSDFFADCEIWQQSWLKATAGAQSGMSTASGKDMDKWLQKCKGDLIGNGGYNGSMTGAGLGTGGAGAAQAVKRLIKRSTKVGAMKGSSGADIDVADGGQQTNELKQGTSVAGVKNQAASLLSDAGNKIDASQMAKMSGINRHSPTLFGGPHGSSLSPLTLQGYYDISNKFLRNVPRIAPNKAGDFGHQNLDEWFQGVNSYYNDEANNGMSPTRSMNLLKKGITTYTYDYMTQQYQKYEMIRGTAAYVDGKATYNFPPTYNGNKIFYIGEIMYSYRQEFQPLSMWGNTIFDRQRYWTQYYSYWSDLNIRIGPLYINNTLGYQTSIREASRLGYYWATRIKTYKKYLCHDEPDLSWSITQQVFNQFKAGSGVWSFVNKFKEKTGLRSPKNIGQITSERMAFVLKFKDQATEDDFKVNMIEKGRNGLPPQLIFLEGNESKRYVDGPDSIFIATCKIDYYESMYKWSWRHKYTKGKHEGNNSLLSKVFGLFGLFQTTHDHWETAKVQVPFISVDLQGNIPLFQDKLNSRIFSNMYKGSPSIPLQFESIPNDEDYISHATDILHKFKNKYNIIIGSYEETPQYDNLLRKFRNPLTYSGGGYIEEPPSNQMRPQENSTVQGGVWGGNEDFRLAKYEPPGYKVQYYDYTRDAGKTKDRYTGSPIQTRKVIWQSIGIKGISGIGILSQLQGLEQDDDIGDSSKSESLVALSRRSIDVPLKNIPRETHYYITSSSTKYTNSNDGSDIWTVPSNPNYGSKPMDDGLKKALSTLVARSTFHRNDEPDREYFIGLDSQFRVFYNMVLYQLSFLKIIKEFLLDPIDFEIMQKMIGECIDKCVASACGYSAVDGLIGSDPNHILYDYWIDYAIQLFGDKNKHAENKNKIIADIQNRITQYEYLETVMKDVVKLPILEWTYNQISFVYDQIVSFNELVKTSSSDRYLFAYLHMLYQYRMFFIGKRFNKEDGTMWVMRALESVIEFIAPYGNQDNPPNINNLKNNEPAEKVAFFKVQNSSYMKQDSVINNKQLDPDRIKTVYVRVRWGTEKQYDDWVRYQVEPKKFKEIPTEIIKIYKPKKNGKHVLKYAKKPIDGVYTLISKELLEDQKNIKWNNTHQKETQRIIRDDVDWSQWEIQWKDTPGKTPIIWNVFDSIDPSALLEYVNDGLTPEELICIAEQGADYWTIEVPENMWPRASAFKEQVKLKRYDPIKPINTVLGDPIFTLLGSMGYSLWPISEQQERPCPGVSINPDTAKTLTGGVNAF